MSGNSEKVSAMSEWEIDGGRLAQLLPVIRLRAADGWTLHSWNMFTQKEGGGRIAVYDEQMFMAVFYKEANR